VGLRVGQLEEIQALLRRTPPLMDSYETRDPGFTEQATAWLKQAETLLEQNRLHVVSVVANLRGTIFAAGRGQRVEGVEVTGRPTRRKLSEAAAVRALREASVVIQDSIAMRSAQVGEASKLAQQILAIAALKQLVQPCLNLPGHQARLECIRSAVRRDTDLVPLYAALAGLVSDHDALVLLDRAIANVVF